GIGRQWRVTCGAQCHDAGWAWGSPSAWRPWRCSPLPAVPPTPARLRPPGIQAYVDCLGRNGVNLPTGAGGRSPGAGRPSFSARPSFSPNPSFSPRPDRSGRPGASGGTGGGFGGGFFGTNPPAGVDANTWAKA